MCFTIYSDEFDLSHSDWLGVRNAILQELSRQWTTSPSTPGESTFEDGLVSGLIIGGGGSARAAVYALSALNCKPIYLLNRDDGELRSLTLQFPGIDLIPMWSRNPEHLVRQAQPYPALSIVVGCIPALPPVTPEENATVSCAEELLAMPFEITDVAPKQATDHLPMPRQRIFLDMCYKPRVTPLIQHATQSGQCASISGIEAMLEQGFAQSRMWLASSADRGVGLGAGDLPEGNRAKLLTTEIQNRVREMIRQLPDITLQTPL
jgi:quinate dehydrogenase